MTTSLRMDDVHAQHAAIEREISAALRRVLDRGDFVLGAAVRVFDAAFASNCRVPHAISVGSGTDALSLAMRALDFGGRATR
jgi:dTDP-4-amino-4,6-dideoxygalactose transaminase